MLTTGNRGRTPLKLGLTLSLILLLFTASPAWPQGFQGTIRGSVQDPTGALIPNANITITNTATGETRTQLTSSTGTFNFPNLLVGEYSVTAELQGFKKVTRENVAVTASTVTDVVTRMEVGAVTEEVSVTAGADLVRVSTAQLEGYTTKNVSEYPTPLLSGNPNNFAILAPGTTTMPGGMAGRGGSVGGNRPRNNNFVLDGVDNNDPSVTGDLAPVISDAVSEFTLITNQFSAEYGHSTAGQFITTTRSGENELHGRGWWYSQNRDLNSLDNLTRAVTKPGNPKPRYDYNRFGGQAGGRIIKDKWFYFGAYEYRNLSQAGASSGEILVPTAAGLSTLQSLAGNPATGISKTTVDILANFVPVAAAQSRATTITNEALPAGANQVTIPLGQFSTTTPQFDRTHLFLGSSDYQTGTHRISGRYSHSRNRQIVAGNLPTAQFNSNVSFDTHRAVFSDVWTVNPRTVNEFRAGFNRAVSNNPVSLPPAPGRTDVFGNYGVQDLSLFIGPLSNYPQTNKRNVYQFLDSVSIVSGAHTLKFGAEMRNIIANGDFLPRARAEFTYTNLDEFVRDRFPTNTSIRGVGLGAYTQNRPAYYAFAQDSWKLHPRVTLEYGLRYEYTLPARDQDLQDLNGIANIVSVRDEVYTTDYPGITATSPNLGRKIFDTLPGYHQKAILDRVGENLIFRRPSPDNNNFAPRIGLAWDITGDGRTSLRAGAGIAYDVYFGNLALLQLPPQLQAENRETNACAITPSPAWCAAPGATTNPRTADIRANTIGFLAGGGLLPVLPPATRINRFTARNLTGNYVFADETVPETYTWSLSLQREQFKGWLFEARYVGNHVVHLPIQLHKNPAVPNPVQLPLFMNEGEARSTNFSGRPTLLQFQQAQTRILAPYGFNGVITEFAPSGQSWYHGGSFSATRHLSKGLEVNSSYTFSKTLDVIENELNTSAINPRRPKNMYDVFDNKGLSGIHRAHKFVASWIYEFPRFNDGNGALGRALSGWRINGMYIAESGMPFSMLAGRDVNGDGDTAGDTAFFNPNGNRNVGSDVNFVCWNGAAASTAASAAACGGAGSVVGYVSRDSSAAFIRGQAGMPGNLARGTGKMPGISTTNLALQKNIRFWDEGRQIQFRAEMWNAFNHPSYTLGTGTVIGQTTPALTTQGYALPGSPQFLNKGVLSGSLGNSPFQRIIQFGLKMLF